MARDTKEHPEDLDGLAKNLDKLGKEADKMKSAARDALDGDSHDKVMDAVTEATRSSPYGMSHLIVAVVAVLVVALAIALWI